MSVKDQGMDALANVQAVAAEFDDIPIEAVVKEDCLRRGVWFEPETLRLGHAYARKSYFIFSFDHLPLEEMEEESVRDDAPEEIQLEGGPWAVSYTHLTLPTNREV